jgi:hypothetical protein
MRVARWESMNAKRAAKADPLGKRGHLGFPGRDSQSGRSPSVRPAGADPGRIRSPGSSTGEHQSSGPSGPTQGRVGPYRPDSPESRDTASRQGEAAPEAR